MQDALAVVISAAVWWIPTFLGLSDLQRRAGLPRPVVWKWTAILVVPVIGAVLYFWRGRQSLDAQRNRTR